jgi:hypothetical protein
MVDSKKQTASRKSTSTEEIPAPVLLFKEKRERAREK